MKIGIFYFSGTGNTKALVNVIKATLEKESNEVEVRNIADGWFENYDDYDFFSFWSPKYYEYIPLFFLNFLKKNISKCSKPIDGAVFLSAGGEFHCGYKQIISILRDKNINIKATKTIKMVNNYSLPPFDKFSSSTEEEQIASCKSGEKTAEKFALDIVNGEMEIETANYFVEKICYGVAYIYGKKGGKVPRSFSVSEKCIKCGACVRGCPQENIIIKDGKITFDDNCIVCSRCLNICPTNAILYKGKEVEQYKLRLKEIK